MNAREHECFNQLILEAALSHYYLKQKMPDRTGATSLDVGRFMRMTGRSRLLYSMEAVMRDCLNRLKIRWEWSGDSRKFFLYLHEQSVEVVGQMVFVGNTAIGKVPVDERTGEGVA